MNLHALSFFGIFLFTTNFVFSQSLVISNKGQMFDTKSNWTVTGTNPKIINVEGDAEIHPSVIGNFLKSGVNVSIVSKGEIYIKSSIINDGSNKSQIQFISKNNKNIQLTENVKIVSSKSKLNVFFKTEGSIDISLNSAIQSNGGEIRLQAFEESKILKRNPTTKIEVLGTLNASSELKGGDIIIESDAIHLSSNAKILSKGNFGGGTILLGGDWQGGKEKTKKESEDIYEAISINMEEGALIDASAMVNGNGGKVVLWSTLNHPRSNTTAQGQILALAKGRGKGGQIETSGGSVDFEKIKVSTMASDGSAGEWLIDPWNFYFTSAQLTTLASNLASNNISVSTGSATITNASNPNILFGKGHIVLQADFTYSGANARTLTLTSNEDIWINGNITSTGGALSLVFNAPSTKRVLVDGDISTKGGSFTVNNNATVHFQKPSGTQTISTSGGSISLINSNIKLLRHDGTLVLNSGGGTFETWGVGTVDQIDTRYTISGPTFLYGWGGAHVSGSKTYGINIVSGREYYIRLYFWDTWDNERGELIVNENGTYRYYFTAQRTINGGGNELNTIVSNYGTQYQITGPSNYGQAGSNDVYVDVAFVAQHSGVLTTWTNLNQGTSDESFEIYNLYETPFSTTSFTTGSRSLELISSSGQILCGTKNFSGLANLTFNTNNTLGYLDGNISGTTNVIKTGTGSVRLSGVNSYTGSTTVNAGTLRLFPYGSGYTLSGNVINNGSITYETGNVNNRGPIFLTGATSGSGTWSIGSTDGVAPSTIYNNRLIIAGSPTISGQITVLNNGNLWLEGANINITSPINLNGSASRLRVYGPNNATIKTGPITGNGIADFPDGGGGKDLTLEINTGNSNAQFDGVFSNSSTANGPTILRLAKIGSGTYTLTQNNTYSGTTSINEGLLVLQNNAPNPSNKTYNGVGQLRIEPLSDTFTSGFSTSGWIYNNTLTGLTIGKNTNTSDVTLASTAIINGPVTIFAGKIFLQADINTSSANGAVFLEGRTSISSNSTTRSVNSGAGNISISTDCLVQSNGNSLTISSTGHFLFYPYNTAWSCYAATLNFQGSTNAGNFIGAGDAAGLAINNIANLTGFTLGKTGNTSSIAIQAPFTINGPINLLGGDLIVISDIGTTNTSAGDILLKGTSLSNVGNISIASERKLTIDVSGNGNYSGIISGMNSTLVKQGSGMQTLLGNNNFTGITTISGGTLQIGSNSTSGSLGTGNITNNANLIFNRSDDISCSNIISGSGSLNKMGAGTLSLTANNTYAGITTVSEGTLQIGNGGSTGRLGSGAVTVSSNSTLNFNLNTATSFNNGFNYNYAGAKIANISSISGAMITLSGGVNAGNVINTTLDGGTAGITVSGTATPTAPGAGVWIKGDVTFTGNDLNTLVILSVGSGSTIRFKTNATTWFYGALTAENAPNIEVDSGVTISQNASQAAGSLFYNSLSGSGTLSLAGTAATHYILGQSSVSNLSATNNIALVVGQGGAPGSITSGNITANNGITLNSTSSYIFSGVLAGTTLTKQNTNTVTLTGANTYTGTTTISGGTLQIGNNGTTGNIGSGSIVNNGTLSINRSDNITLSNAISGTGIVNKLNNTTATFTNNNSYSGATNITGTLVLQNNAPTSSATTYQGTGNLQIEPSSSSFTSAFSTSGWKTNATLTGLTIGKLSNTANVSVDVADTIAGPITIYGGTLALNENLTSSNGSTISLYGNGLSIATGKTISSTGGTLILAPQTASNTIGLGGAAGTLQLPASYFSTNFTDGFSNIQIGSISQTGNISMNAITLRDNMTLLTTGSLTLGGKPVLGNNNLTLGSAISSITGMPTQYFQTNGTGSVVRPITNSTNFLFPVGNTSYNPITITNKTGTLDTFSIGVLDSTYLNGVSSGIISKSYVKRTWNISKNTASANTGAGVDLTFNWNANEIVGTLSNPTLNHYNGTAWEIPTMGTSSVSGNSLTYTGYKGTFSPFAIGGSSTFALPVELKSFVAECNSDQVKVEWTTSSEKNNERFELYKSSDAKEWTKIYTVQGQGTKATETNYTFNDFQKGIVYYKLKDIDYNGKAMESQIIFVDCNDETNQIQIYPNPASDYIKVLIPFEENTTLNILNLEGKILKTIPLVSKNSLIDIKDLSSGIYLIEYIKQSVKERIKFNKI